MAVEEAGPNPERLAAAIHMQLKWDSRAIPVHAIAHALGIVEIRKTPLQSFEGALVMSADRWDGMILANASSSAQRRRYTVGHELGHFLNVWHEPPYPDRFACTTKDLSTPWSGLSANESRYRLQESQANRFAIELLAPAGRVERFLKGVPDLAQIVALAADLDISKEAAGRRYVQLNSRPTAIIFGNNETVRYIERHPSFPFVSCRPGEPLPSCQTKPDSAGLTGHIEADPSDWLARSPRGELLMQRLFQDGGYSMTLLMLEHEETGEDAGP
jgi:Zn-dependent peptidase ImmA (M78 family)